MGDPYQSTTNSFPPYTNPNDPTSGSNPSAGSSHGSESGRPSPELWKIHGILMSLTVIILLPLGALSMRILPTPWWLHGLLQVLFLLLFTGGWGFGYHLASYIHVLFEGQGTTHTILGTVLLAIFWLMPVLGYAHHLMFKRKGKRTGVSYGHIWLGRISFVLAVVNGGLGLRLSGNMTGGTTAYAIVAGVVGVVYLAGVVYGEQKRAAKIKAAEKNNMDLKRLDEGNVIPLRYA